TLGGFVIMVKMTNYLMPGPWTDVRVRRAINYAIDMDTIIKTVLEGYGTVLGVPLEKEAFGFNPNIKWYGYDPERAKALLREAREGAPGGGGDGDGLRTAAARPNPPLHERHRSDAGHGPDARQGGHQGQGRSVGAEHLHDQVAEARAAPRLHGGVGRRGRVR